MKKGEIEENKVETLYWLCCLQQKPVWHQEIKQQQTLYFQVSKSSNKNIQKSVIFYSVLQFL